MKSKGGELHVTGAQFGWTMALIYHACRLVVGALTQTLTLTDLGWMVVSAALMGLLLSAIFSDSPPLQLAWQVRWSAGRLTTVQFKFNAGPEPKPQQL
ncbi:MAG TPA: hypothetical protein VLI05_01730 [Candidatus Saccharimonadia bacterium]|nr:hypothetical protein [Candidatus Saccharimonadia bacterium]